jgi:YesN/AraC family two-component response regulator
MEDEIRVLLVDDEQNFLRSLEKTFLRQGYDVDTAGGNEDALELFQEAIEEGEPFGVVIVDLNMPDFDGKTSPNAGLHLVEKLMEVAPEVNIIVLSAFDEVEKAKSATRIGARDYFVKGRDEDLLDKVENVLEG